MKKTKNSFLVLFSALFLAGCSLTGGSADGGVFRSDNGGENFTLKATIDEKTKISSVDILCLVANPQNGSEVYIGTKANGLLKTTDGGEKWQIIKLSQAAVSKTYSIAIDPMNPSVIYVATIVGGRGKILKSTDSGATWNDVYTEPTSASFVLALAIDPAGSGKIYGGTTKGLILFSDNGGDSWQNLNDVKKEVFKITIDSMNSNLVYFAINQNGLMRTKDGGKSFENVGANNILSSKQRLGNPTAIVTDPNRTNWIYAGNNTGLYRSKDGGDTWEIVRVLNSPQQIAIRGIDINPQNSDEIVYGAAQAFYKSIDGGQSWATTQFGGSRTIEQIAYNRQNPSVIYVGMNKR